MKTRVPTLATLAFAAFFMFGASSSHASNGFLVFNTFAYHFDNADERRDFTPGIGIEYSPTNRLGFHLGTLSDSFGYQAAYGGLNYATPRFFKNRVRLMITATALHKKYGINIEPETKIVPLPAIEFSFTERAVLNISGSPRVDYGNVSNNPVVWFQFKLGLL